MKFFQFNGHWIGTTGCDRCGKIHVSQINDLVRWVREHRTEINNALEVSLAEDARYLYQQTANLRGQLGEYEEAIKDNQQRRQHLLSETTDT